MSYVVLARRYRPQKFEEVIGQEHVTTVLTNAILSNRVAHAYLFSGPRGVGKTTMARLLSKALNCKEGSTPTPCCVCEHCIEITNGSSVDIIEIDGASNRGIDDVRELREQVRFSPVKERYKIYIIDEVHMLTEEAFNALLKTLEEPPSYTVFILATTASHKVPVTIKSRCQNFQFKRISAPNIIKQLKIIAQKEKIEVNHEVMNLIANYAEGALRDAISIFDQLLANKKEALKPDDVIQLLGIVPQDTLAGLTDYVFKKSVDAAISIFEDILTQGYDVHQFVKSLLLYMRNLLIAKLCKEPADLINLPKEQVILVQEQAKKYNLDLIQQAIRIIKELDNELRFSNQPRIAFELALAKLIRLDEGVELTKLVERLHVLEVKLSSAGSVNVVETESPKEIKQVEKDENAIEGDGATLVIQELEDATEDNKIKTLWPEVLEIIKAKKMAVYGLLHGSKIIGGDSGTIVIQLTSNYHKETLEKLEHKRIVDDAISEVFRQPLRVKWELLQKEQPKLPEHKHLSQVKPTEPVSPVVKNALKIFGGRVVGK